MAAIKELGLLLLITHEARRFYRTWWLPCTFSESESISSLVHYAVLWAGREVHAPWWRRYYFSTGRCPSLQDALWVSQGELLAVTDNGQAFCHQFEVISKFL